MLSGRTILIVEAQYLIAFDLQTTLEDLNPAQIVLARDAVHAGEMLDTLADCHLAIVEVERELPAHISLIAELRRRGADVIGLTADPALPQNLAGMRDMQVLLKPVPTDRVLDAVGKLQKSQKE